jgi:clan AA aspartic protease (TIGR02281 family)
MIRCSKCRTRNPDTSNFCSACGHPLRWRHHGLRISLWLVAAAAFGAGIALVVLRQPPPAETEKIPISAPRRGLSDNSEIQPVAPGSAPRSRSSTPEPVGVALSVGRVILESVSGENLAEFPTAVVAGGWTALPRRVCLGGYRWRLRTQKQLEVEIVGGILGDQDEVGLWRIQDDQWLESPQLSSWRVGEPLMWQSIVSATRLPVTHVTVVSEQQYVTRIAVAQAIREPGVYVQHGAVVGWTFGHLLPDAGFLWRGLEGDDLTYRMRVDDFYRLTFADGREEAFMRALSMGSDYSDAQRLKAMAEAFYHEPRLNREQTPAHLTREHITNNMRALIAGMLKQGSPGDVADGFDAWILVAAGDVSLVGDVIQATVASQGYEDAVSLLDEVIDRIEVRSNAEQARLAAFQSTLYASWVTYLVEQGDLEGAWRAFYHGDRRLPDDPNVLLAGVQVALAEGNWREASRLLQSRDYPLDLKQRVEAFQARIAELETRENKIVIRFTPGTRHIQVNATLNRALRQRFVIDTGASLTTIPSSIADKLGLMDSGDYAMRAVYTAGGVREAPEVRLPVIAIDGYEIRDVRALVLDIPEQPDLGLLGLDFLQRFRMDLNSENGVLLLEPR